MQRTHPSPEDYGHNVYRHFRDGRRQLVGTTRTIRPYPAEEADVAAFEARIARMVERLFDDYGVESVETDFERKGGKAVLCTVTVRWDAAVTLEVGGRLAA